MKEAFELARAHRRHGPNAYMLLLQLRGDYADLCRVGGTFTITPKVRARAGDPFRWTRERYENSRNVLLRTGFIEQVEPFRMTESGPRPARYRLTIKGIESMEERTARKRLALTPAANALPI
jgi:hypothetical protein